MILDDGNIAVLDASVILDLINLDLLDKLFHFDTDVAITPSILLEITSEPHKSKVQMCIDKGKILLRTDGLLENINTLYEKFPGLSYADCSVLEVAIRINAMVLSSDGLLRKVIKKHGLNIKGTLGVIKDLHEKKLIETEVAISKLEKYLKINQRAPKDQTLTAISELKSLKIIL